jgi:Sulfotransferase domain
VFRLPAELVPRIPAPARAVVRNAVWTYGRATAGLRPLPDFLVIGAQKAGTTALYAYLRWHPSIGGPSWKEVSFFDRHYARGASWYRGQFPNALRLRLARRNGAHPIVGEASPSYLFHPLAPERVAALLPDVRLIAILRDPVDRALSHYHHEVSLGREPLSFEHALEREEERTRGEVERMIDDPAYFSHAWWNFTYRARGLYAEQLERWLAVVPRERLLVLASEELLGRPDETYARVLEFLGAPPHRLDTYPRVFERQYREMRPETCVALAESFAEPNRRLAELLGRDLGWNRTGEPS